MASQSSNYKKPTSDRKHEKKERKCLMCGTKFTLRVTMGSVSVNRAKAHPAPWHGGIDRGSKFSHLGGRDGINSASDEATAARKTDILST